MSHLSIERFAALADGQPTVEEQRHLAQCDLCAREVDAHRSLREMASRERDTTQLPLTRWDALAERLRQDGLIGGPRAHPGWRAALRLKAGRARLPLQIAAALLLVAGGVVMGRVSVGAPVLPGGIVDMQSPRQDQRFATSLPTSFASIDEATRWKDAYADAYQRTVSFLAANDSAARPVGAPAVIRARLSALDRVSRVTREALNDAPYDPVINDFYLNAFGQREVTLRQLNTVLPQGVRLRSF